MEKMFQIDSTTYRYEDDFVRCFLLIGNDKAMWIDSGVSGPDLIAIAKEYIDLPLVLLNTHGDGDHVSSNGLFDEFYISEADYIACGVKERFPDAKMIPIKEGDEIDLGGRTLKIFDIPGHTVGSIAILDVEKRRLFAGDSVQTGNVFLFGEHRDSGLYKAALEKMIAIKDTYDEILPSHDDPVLKPEAVEKTLKDWNDVCDGKIKPEKVDFFGNPVDCATGEFCGFFI